MFFVISLIFFSIFLCLKNKFYFFCILPILLFLNYIFFYVVTNTNLIDNEFLDRTLETYAFNFEGNNRTNIDFELVNKITNSITFFYIQIIISSYIFSKTKIVKKLSIKILNVINQFFFKLNLNSDSLSKYKNQKNSLNIFEIFLLIIILTHAISFYTSDFLIYHREYLFINKEDYYSLYPKLSIILVKSLNSVFPIFFISRIFKSGINYFKDPINTLVFLHSIILYSSVNSRWVFVYLISFTMYFFLKVFLDSKNKFSKKIYSLIILLSGGFFSILSFHKSLYLRSRLSGLGTLFFSFNEIQFSTLSSLQNIFSSFLSSIFVIYSGVYQDIQTSLEFDIISLIPIPSYLLRVNTTVLQQVARVSTFAPSPIYVQIYQNNYFYQFIIIILFGFVLAIISNQRKLLIKLKKQKYKILNFYPNAYELLITFILIIGFQYYSRTIMTYFWWEFLFLIIFPTLISIFIVRDKNTIKQIKGL